ncbi:Xaa-Pro aminopeptidase [Alteracholeplasma palmae J233]|uniref:Xaa-Pro aminopeptidase n=1 Tax=Alteracholeplasma palmae (strain ATCC 49389 / J233) TaxID=1318466 RepID=U4KKV8_ALTPJ|nr:aminopeptidase P family protein [Alteracholeplasma palmae]CCV64342.1 Xaa-Pro aminopeptidase [Alteracholeplasma palmae J233]
MFKENRNNYLKELKEQSISIFYSGRAQHKSADQKFPFVVNRNFFYLTGIEQQESVVLLIKGNQTTKTLLFIEKQDPLKALWDGETLSFKEAANIAGLEENECLDIATLDTYLAQYLGHTRRSLYGTIENLYFDLERHGLNEPKSISEQEANRIKDLYPHLAIYNGYPIVSELRKVKSEFEVNQIKKAISITKDALEGVMQKLKPGKYEYQVEADYDYTLSYNNVKPSFDTIAAAGKNATVLHYVDNDYKIGDNELILLDLGVSYQNYCSDISRTYPASGKYTEQQKQIYEIVLEANKKTIEWVKAGHTYKEFNDYGRNILIAGMKRLGLIKEDSEINKYYYHSLGHYLGLDVHDVGNTTKVIPAGAILTVEPGLYIAELGIGIRIEDNILITEGKAINLSKDLIKEVSDIEAYMAKNKK